MNSFAFFRPKTFYTFSGGRNTSPGRGSNNGLHTARFSSVRVSMLMGILLFFLIPGMSGAQELTQAGSAHEAKLESSDWNTVYLHLDKAEYFAGDIIWFRAYVVNPFSFVPYKGKTNLFVELTHSSGISLMEGVYAAEEGTAGGHITLPDTLPDGNYILRAFTADAFANPMLVFRRELYIQNPQEAAYISRASIRQNRRFNSSLEEKRSTFTAEVKAESGSLVAGIPGRLVLATGNRLNEGQEGVSWQVLGADNQVVTEGVTGPMGYSVANLQPTAGAAYRVVFRPEGESAHRVNVPAVQSEGVTLQLNSAVDEVFGFELFASPGIQADLDFVVHGGGKVYFMQRLGQNARQQVAVPRQALLPGVNVASVVSPQGDILAERLFFVQQPRLPRFEVHVQTPGERDGSGLGIDLVAASAGTIGEFSVSITDFRAEEFVRPFSIFSDLYLSSRLGVHVSEPARLFEDSLMLPVLDKVLAMAELNRPAPVQRDLTRQALFADKLTVEGQVQVMSSRLVTGILPVELSINVDGAQTLFNTPTDADGRFVFRDVDFKGFGKAQVTFGQDFLNRRMQVKLFSSFPQLTDPFVNSHTRLLQILERGDSWRRVPPYLVPRERVQQQRVQPASSPFGSPNQVVYVSDMVSNYNSTYEVLATQIPGLSFEGIGVVLRGPGSMASSNHALLMVDGVEASLNAFLNLPPSELSRIEVFKSNNAAIFGFRGVNGVIIAYTRRANNDIRENTFDFVVSGYSLPRDFDPGLIEAPNRFSDGYVNTYLWEPKPLWQDGRVSLSINPERIRGNLLLHMEGIDDTGNLFQQKVVIRLGE